MWPTAVALALVLVATGGVAASLFVRRPLAVLAWLGRRSLRRAGLAMHRRQTPSGPVVFFEGGAGPTLAFLHGAGDQAGSWARTVRPLVRRFHVVVPDLPGHGDSAPANGPLPMETFLAGASAVLDEVTVAVPAIIVGHSLGAWVATLYAARRPERVARLVLVNGGAILGERSDVNLMPRDRAEAARVLAELRDPSSPKVPGYLLDDIVRQANAGPIARMAAAAATLPPFLMDGRLGSIAIPVDLLWGESDRMMPVAYARRMLEAFPAARLTMIPRCGHVPQHESPRGFRAALDGVLAAGPPATRPAETSA